MSTRLKAPFPWFGGKSLAANLIWERLGDVANYVEPFAGSLAILLARPHQPRIETVNDRDCYLANFWRAVKSDPDHVAHCADWPVSECDLRARHRWLVEQPGFREKLLIDPEFYDAKIAGWWVWGISQWIGAGWCSRPEWEGRGQGGRAPRGINSEHNGVHITSSMGIHSGNLDGKQKRPVINHGSRGVTNLPGPQGQQVGYPEWEIRPDLRAPMGVHSKLPIMTRGGHGVEGAQYGKRPHLSGYASTGVHSQQPIYFWMQALADRLRRVRVCCGDWSRIVTPSCTWKLGGGTLTGVLLDPPYSHQVRDKRLYAVEDRGLSDQVREWAIGAGENNKMRIALCGLEGEHEMPIGWIKEPWRCSRGYSNKGKRLEVIWFSPACRQPGLFGDSTREEEVAGQETAGFRPMQAPAS